MVEDFGYLQFNVYFSVNIFVNNLQLTGSQLRRGQELQRLRDLVYQIENDKAVRLDTSWKAYFKGCLDWCNGDGQAARFSDIEKHYKDVQQQVSSTICLFELMMSIFVWVLCG